MSKPPVGPISVDDELARLRGEVEELRRRLAASGRVGGETREGAVPLVRYPDESELSDSRASVDQLRQLAREQRTILDTVSAGICLLKRDRIVWANRGLAAILGYSATELRDQLTDSLYADQADFERVRTQGYLLLTKQPYATQVRLRRKSGEIFWCELAGRAIDPEQMEEGSIWVLQDISERRAWEAALLQSMQRLDAAQAQARIGSWELGFEGQPNYWSPQMFSFFALDANLGPPPLHQFFELVHQDDRESLVTAHRTAAETGNPQNIRYRRHPSLGPLMVFHAHLDAERDAAGRLVRMSGTLQDITELHEAEESLRTSRARLEAAQAQAHIGSWEMDPHTGASVWSSEMMRLTGLDSPSPSLIDATAELVHPDDRAMVAELYRRAIDANEPGSCEYRSHPSRGPERVFCLTCEATRDAFGRTHRISGTLQDVTERKRAEKESVRLQNQLQQAMKMEAVGRLAGGVAHDFNNLLTVILGNTELARMDLDPADPLAQHLAEVANAAASASNLTRQLLAFSRRQMIEPRVVNLNDLVGNLRKMLERVIGEDVTLSTQLAPALGSVNVDPGQFEQVLVNLAVNARDAMPKGGRLLIETADIEIDEAWCELHPGLAPGDFVMLAVTDNGVGMSDDVKQRIFEPFFTTKPQGVGTGLGLATIFGIVKQAGGTLEVYSEQGHGTTFKIYVPRTHGPAEKLARRGNATDLPRGHETILIVEDEASVRDLSAQFLRRQGYQVLTAANGGEALLAAESTRDIDLLLTDLVLPGLNGREIAERIQRVIPTMSVLFTSGYTEDTILRHGVMSEQLHFIGKPFAFQALVRKVRQVLDGRPGRP